MTGFKQPARQPQCDPAGQASCLLDDAHHRAVFGRISVVCTRLSRLGDYSEHRFSSDREYHRLENVTARRHRVSSDSSPVLPNQVDAEPAALIFDVAERLRSYGHIINPKLRSQGDVHAVMIEGGSGWRIGWSDGRRGGRAAGY